MLLYIIGLIVGFAALAWSADRFVLGAAGAANQLGLSPLVIGLTIVALGTSAPELLVSGLAAWHGSPGLAIGNAVGSNIANMGLILGATALVAPLAIHSRLLRRELPVLFATILLCWALLWNGQLSRLESSALLLGLVALILFLLWESHRKSARTDPIASEFAAEIPSGLSVGRAALWLTVGLIGLLLSARLCVWAAVELAQLFGVSDLVIGLSIVALGTSLPELAASIASVRRGEHDIAIGNLIGSNMFNLLGVMGLAGLIAPTAVESGVIERDFAVMFGLTAAAVVMSRGLGSPGHIGRLGGALLLLAYAGYQLWLYLVSGS
ncbi:calcium/sodium antiporter [Alkalilimnicola ehrlichii]|uniref:Calcium/sodium antiporter n=1 Tax=Alkalilimnicola ehrlichii TaxID=351052 RepID=A0A3E0X0D3_9GAMM|nr:calcium/sodium antiporter [Alkalilimnicola ehrlichii]RFA30291.1 calcium/sodium antiporter [Alkalilimnicola ehrlichii]RFA37871.1 calcium/sodium antiporter [Alkalilimnicola ehrlichii]